ncbi:MAG: hypothetical protein E7006_03860 [Alphaproteobacteria bacterium]|nr:hypothetical protein [Alphaproteobacteria bacterium]
MIKKNFVLAISVFALFATGAVHADIASTKYVDEYVDEKLPAAGNTSTPVYIDNDGKAAAVTAIASSLLPVAEFYPAVDYWDSAESELGMVGGIRYASDAEMYYYGDGFDQYGYGPGIRSDGTIVIPYAMAENQESVPMPVAGVVWVAGNDDEYESSLSMSEEMANLDAAGDAGSVVPTVKYMKGEIAANKPNAAGDTSKPVYVNSSGQVKAVSRIAASLLPVAPTYRDVVDHGLEMAPGAVYIASREDDYNNMSEDYDYLMDALVPNVSYMKDAIAANTPPLASFARMNLGADPYAREPGVVTGVDFLTAAELTFSRDGEEDAYGPIIEDGVIGIPFATPDGLNGVPVPGVVWVVDDDDELLDADDQSLNWADSATSDEAGRIVPSVEYMKNEIEENKLTAGTNVTISDLDNSINVATANATTAGVAEWGTVPAGSATSTTSAKIWIE